MHRSRKYPFDARRTRRPGDSSSDQPRHRALGPLSYGRPDTSTRQTATERLRRSWPRAFDGHGGEDGEWQEELDTSREKKRVRSWLERQRRSSRYRKPLVGLAVAGAAAPLVRADGARGPDTGHAAVGEALANAGPESAEAKAERLQQQDQERLRDEVIQGAVARYDIDWDLAADIHDIAREEGVEPKVAFGLVKTESTFRHSAVSPVGARGLTQLLPSTARWIMPELGSRNLHEQETNLRVGFRYLRYLVDKYDGDMEKALLAYNRGPGTVDRVLKRGGNPDNGYA
ncbi:MAG TPA: lytic transglycosylase domain-containing protein, partial [Longimicrobiales bacterium]|nr:lytic transglycosylase domain-containing protein [Longimicrobiales bacterium]